jgi:glycosyltransferase involved in cell wall biosynthesis
VITTRGNGFSEIIQDRIHGSLVDNSAEVKTIRAALEFWSDASRRAEAQPRLFDLAARFDISKNVARTLEILLRPGR